MENVKYEAVFGDQSLFDGAPEDAEYAGWFCQETRWYSKIGAYQSKSINKHLDNNLYNFFIHNYKLFKIKQNNMAEKKHRGIVSAKKLVKFIS